MRFIMTPVGASGDVHPFVGIGRALKARGHEVIVLTAGPFGAVVRKAGLIFQETVTTEEYDAVSRHPDIWHPRRGLRLVLDSVVSRLAFAFGRLNELHKPRRPRFF